MYEGDAVNGVNADGKTKNTKAYTILAGHQNLYSLKHVSGTEGKSAGYLLLPALLGYSQTSL
jgi:hypothetical protein